MVKIIISRQKGYDLISEIKKLLQKGYDSDYEGGYTILRDGLKEISKILESADDLILEK